VAKKLAELLVNAYRKELADKAPVAEAELAAARLTRCARPADR